MKSKIKELGSNPQAEWMDGALCGVEPVIMGVGLVESTRTVFRKLRLGVEDMHCRSERGVCGSGNGR